MVTPTHELQETAPGLLCLVPKDVPAEVTDCLRQYFEQTHISVKVTEGRRRERRSGAERRNDSDAAQMMERRFAPGLEARRFAERRAELERVETPILPSTAVPYADRLRFVRRRPRAIDDFELTRLRSMAAAWRDRARTHEREAQGLLRSLVGAVEDLRQMRILSPRWFLAVRRGDQAIAEHRDRHLTP